MRTSDDMIGSYGGGAWVPRWTLTDGLPTCPEDAVPADHPEVEAIRARNAELRSAVVTVEAYEAAARLVAQIDTIDAPSETLPSIGPDGQPAAMQNPAWVAWQAALETVAGASSRTRALAVIRRYGSAPPPAEVDGAPNPERTAYDAARLLWEE